MKAILCGCTGKGIFSGFIQTMQFVEKQHNLTLKTLILWGFLLLDDFTLYIGNAALMMIVYEIIIYRYEKMESRPSCVMELGYVYVSHILEQRIGFA